MLPSPVKYIAVFTLSAVFANAAQAQFLRGLQDRLVNAVEERVEQNVEDRVVQEIEQSASQAVDQTFNAMFGGDPGAAGADGKSGASILSRMMDTSDIATRDTYDFNLAATFEMQGFDKNGTPSEPVELVFHYADNAPYTGTQIVGADAANAGAAMIIYDFENQLMLMMMDSEDSRFSMAYNWAFASGEANNAWDTSATNAANAGDAPRFEHIGSRTINGYASEGYRTSDATHVTEIWISEDVAPGIERIFQANRTVPTLNSGMPAGYPQGMLMELNSQDTKTGEKMQMRTTSIDTNSRVNYRMSDYPLVSLGAVPESR